MADTPEILTHIMTRRDELSKTADDLAARQEEYQTMLDELEKHLCSVNGAVQVLDEILDTFNPK